MPAQPRLVTASAVAPAALPANHADVYHRQLDVPSRSRLRQASVVVVAVIVGLASVGVVVSRLNAQSSSIPHRSSAVSTPLSTASTVTSALTPSTTAQTQAIQSAINGLSTRTRTPAGITVINLKTGVITATNADYQFISASLYKLFVAEAIYRGIDGGSIHPNATVGQTGMSVTNCLKLMITISDNNCGIDMGSMVGWERQNEHLHQAGYVNTILSKVGAQQTSAHDVGLLLQRLYAGSLVSPTSNAAFLDLLKQQKINNRLPGGLPQGASIAHKTGDLDGLVHDAGIVFSPSGDYVIAALSGPWTQPASAAPAFTQLSREVYAAMSLGK